jgi:hypothetical protein
MVVRNPSSKLCRLARKQLLYFTATTRNKTHQPARTIAHTSASPKNLNSQNDVLLVNLHSDTRCVCFASGL